MTKQQKNRISVRAFLIKDNALLLMLRNKNGQKYYTYIGGGVEDGETLFEAIEREVSEEASLEVIAEKILARAIDQEGLVTYFAHCKYLGGEVKVREDSEEAHDNTLGQNTYTPLWVPLSQLGTLDLPLYPDSPDLLEILHTYSARQTWPDSEIQINLT